MKVYETMMSPDSMKPGEEDTQVKMTKAGVTILKPVDANKTLTLREAVGLSNILRSILDTTPDGKLLRPGERHDATLSELKLEVEYLRKQLKDRRIELAKAYKMAGFSNVAIANKLEISESTVRRMLK